MERPAVPMNIGGCRLVVAPWLAEAPARRAPVVQGLTVHAIGEW